MANYNEERPFVKTENRDMRGNIIDSPDFISTGVSDSINQDDVIRASDCISVGTVEKDSPQQVI